MTFLTYGLNAAVYFGLSTAAFISFYFAWKNKDWKKIGSSFFLLASTFLILALMNFIWFVTPEPAQIFLGIKVIGTAITAFVLGYIGYKLTKRKEVLFLLFLYLMSLAFIDIGVRQLMMFTLLISYIITSVVFFLLYAFSDAHLKKAGLFGLVFSILSVVYTILSIFEPGVMLYWFIPNAMLFISILFFAFEMMYGQKPHEIDGVKIDGKRKKASTIIYFITYILAVNLTIIIASLAFHEIGHVVVGHLAGCEGGKAIILDLSSVPHAELDCPTGAIFITYLGGLIATIFFGLLFFLARGMAGTYLSYIIWGIGFYLANNDLLAVNIPVLLVRLLMMAGLVLVIYGDANFISLYLEYLRKGAVKS